MRRQSRQLGFASTLFLLSGVSALLYQVSWQRILGIFSGMHIYSITMIVTAFMAGLGFGSYFGGRWADRRSAEASTRAFAYCEAAIGLFALVSPWLYYDVAFVKLGFLVRYPAVLPTVHLALLIVPTFLMGASLPLLSRGLVRSLSHAPRSIGVLYGINTLGAAFGAWLSVWYLIGALGFVGTIRLGALLNLLAAAGAWWLASSISQSGREGEVAPDTDADSSPPTRSSLSLGTWAAIYALSGFIALSLEILWFRVLDVTIKSSPYTFGHLLGGFLFFLAVGSLVGAFAVRRIGRSDPVFFWGQWAISLSAGVAIVMLCRLPSDFGPMRELLAFWNTDGGLFLPQMLDAIADPAGEGAGKTLSLMWKTYALVPIALLGMPTFLMGWTFAFIQKNVQTDAASVGWRVGLIQTANIVGSIFGSFFTGTLFLSWFGSAATFRLLILMGSLFGLLAARRLGRIRWPVSFAVLVVAAGLAWAIPSQQAFWARFHGSHPDDVVVAEDASSVVVLQRLTSAQAVLRVNGTGHSMLPYGGIHTLLGVFPVLLHPNPEEVLLIGLGAGNTGWAAASAPALRRMDLYEIAQPEFEVLARYGSRWFPVPSIGQLLTHEKIRFRFSDGRLALRTEPSHYDIIEADALEPTMAYSGNLYSKEFFESAAERLKPGGIFVSYTPTERTRRTMLQVFPYVLHFHGPGLPSLMVGSRDPVPFDSETIRAKMASPEFRAYFDRSGMTRAVTRDLDVFLGAFQVESHSGTPSTSVAGGEINTDLYPRDEYDPRMLP